LQFRYHGSRRESAVAQLFSLGGMRALQLTQSAGRFRRGLFIVAGICTLALMPVAIYGLLTRSTFAGLISWLDWPLSDIVPLVLIIFLADLISEIRGHLSPTEHPWTDRRHFRFTAVVSFVLASALFLYYWVHVQAMVEPVVIGSP
jgi:hypothetical protein